MKIGECLVIERNFGEKRKVGESCMAGVDLDEAETCIT